jgi:hypothetical protein
VTDLAGFLAAIARGSTLSSGGSVRAALSRASIPRSLIAIPLVQSAQIFFAKPYPSSAVSGGP